MKIKEGNIQIYNISCQMYATYFQNLTLLLINTWIVNFRDFLTGFHKRKLQRKKEAKEKFEKDLKEERKRIKAEAKVSYKNLVLSHKPIPELENLINEEYQDQDVSIKVVELSANEMAKKNHWIGANAPIEQQSDEENSSDCNEEYEEVPGMELKLHKESHNKKQKEQMTFDSEKDIKKTLKKQATKNVQKSKVFQLKNKLEQKKQRKKSMKIKKQKIKLQEKKGKKKKSNRIKGKNL